MPIPLLNNHFVPLFISCDSLAEVTDNHPTSGLIPVEHLLVSVRAPILQKVQWACLRP